MFKVFLAALALLLGFSGLAIAADPPKSEEDLRREAAVAEFTRKTKASNYPALFDQAAQEFNVPADVLKGVAFAETRWEHLTWPPGETASPNTGMPRPYGIMSLWDNPYFGHSLTEAAALLGRGADELMQDPLQNIRGAAALLRKIYDETPRPAETAAGDIESWRYAIRKYCGIPEPDLNARHALDVYTFMSRGYHQFGIEWNSRQVNLDPIRLETARIVAEEQAKREAASATNAGTSHPTAPELSANTKTTAELQAQKITPQPAGPPASSSNAESSPAGAIQRNPGWFLAGALVALIGFWLLFRNSSKPPK